MYWNIAELIKVADIYGGVAILQTLENCPLYSAGLQYGDIVVKVNDHEVYDPLTFSSALNGIKDVMTVEYIRYGAVNTISMSVDLKKFANKQGVYVAISDKDFYDDETAS